MESTIEISMYPLREDYEDQILKFIKILSEQKKLNLKVNAMSTQVTGNLDLLMIDLSDAIKVCYKDGVKAAFVLKILPIKLDLEFKM